MSASASGSPARQTPTPKPRPRPRPAPAPAPAPVEDVDDIQFGSATDDIEVEDVTFKNFTLVNGYSEGHGCIGGGGLLVTSENMFDITVPPVTSTPVIENLIIENNWS